MSWRSRSTRTSRSFWRWIGWCGRRGGVSGERNRRGRRGGMDGGELGGWAFCANRLRFGLLTSPSRLAGTDRPTEQRDRVPNSAQVPISRQVPFADSEVHAMICPPPLLVPAEFGGLHRPYFRKYRLV